jgi:Hemerythrin HHE cation binding domain
MRQVTIELVRHSVAEETQVYPAVEKKVSAEEAERAKQEHAEAEQALQRLDGLDPSDPSLDEELARLTAEIVASGGRRAEGRSGRANQSLRSRSPRLCAPAPQPPSPIRKRLARIRR